MRYFINPQRVELVGPVPGMSHSPMDQAAADTREKEFNDIFAQMDYQDLASRFFAAAPSLRFLGLSLPGHASKEYWVMDTRSDLQSTSEATISLPRKISDQEVEKWRVAEGIATPTYFDVY